MVTIELTVAKDDRFILENIILIDKTDQINYDMTLENQEVIKRLLPVQHKNKQIVSIMKINAVITIQ